VGVGVGKEGSRASAYRLGLSSIISGQSFNLYFPVSAVHFEIKEKSRELRAGATGPRVQILKPVQPRGDSNKFYRWV